MSDITDFLLRCQNECHSRLHTTFKVETIEDTRREGSQMGQLNFPNEGLSRGSRPGV